MASKVFLLDVNLLLAAHLGIHPYHNLAVSWLRTADHFATCATTEQGFLRLLSNPVINPGATCADALVALGRVRRRSQHEYWAENASLDDPFISTGSMRGYRQVTDFHLVNLAASRDGIFVTYDTGIESALAPADRRFVKTLKPSV
ncbi:MAG: VapC toxin family PIN domain ribonuclease [Propionibacteriaceae bacterium]|nr:VapC toxin family PIN domain ribonuclease [Propionibacteriaceae bacterium]